MADIKDTSIPGEGRFLSIPYEKLSPEVLRSVIEEHVTRDGTDYGDIELPFEQKIAWVHRELVLGKACIVFDTMDRTCGIVSKSAFLNRFKAGPKA